MSLLYQTLYVGAINKPASLFVCHGILPLHDGETTANVPFGKDRIILHS
jgi:hypothetical protein